MKIRLQRKTYVYTAGGILLGLIYYPLKSGLQNGWLFVAAVIVYVIVLRIVAELVERKFANRKTSSEE